MTGTHSSATRTSDCRMFSSDAAACSRFDRRYSRSAIASHTVWIAIPPNGFARANWASPPSEPTTVVPIPGREVTAPSSRAPAAASPIPVRSASLSAVETSVRPTAMMTTRATTSAMTLGSTGHGGPPITRPNRRVARSAQPPVRSHRRAARDHCGGRDPGGRVLTRATTGSHTRRRTKGRSPSSSGVTVSVSAWQV